jgi:hypothetical protein
MSGVGRKSGKRIPPIFANPPSFEQRCRELLLGVHRRGRAYGGRMRLLAECAGALPPYTSYPIRRHRRIYGPGVMVNIDMIISQLIYDDIANRSVDNARLLAPCCLPQRRPSAPCSPGPVFRLQAFDLHRVMVDPTGFFEGEISFSPCSQGGELSAWPRRGFRRAGPPARKRAQSHARRTSKSASSVAAFRSAPARSSLAKPC